MPCKTPRLTLRESHIFLALALARLTCLPMAVAVTVKLSTLSRSLRRPLKRLFKKADRGSRARCGGGFRHGARILLRAKKFPARSLLGAKKFPASPLKGICREGPLKSRIFLLTPPPKAAPPRRAR